MNGRERYLSTTGGGYSKPTPVPVSSGQGVNTTSDPVANVSTGMGADDLKVQAQQARAAEEKQKYIDKMKAFATSMSSSPGLYGSIYGEGDLGFDAASDPTIDQELYNVEKFSGNVPVSDFQKAKFLSDYGIGEGLGSFMAVDSSGNPILDSSGNPVYSGLGKTMLDNYNVAFDPGGIRYKDGEDEPIDYSGVGIREYLENIEKNYFDQNFYGMDDFDYNYYGGSGGPTEASETFAGAPWSQKGLGEILAEGPKGFGEMESIYGEEFDPERDASFLYLTGIPQFKDQTIYDYV
tara:strand:+ start:1040 stop:1918 length:879 start_codon:yes stop_codon:yes gene_type:complete